VSTQNGERCRTAPMTYSIVARDPATGRFGVAVQSHWFAWAGSCRGPSRRGRRGHPVLRRGLVRTARARSHAPRQVRPEAMDAYCWSTMSGSAAGGDRRCRRRRGHPYGEDCLSLAGHRAATATACRPTSWSVTRCGPPWRGRTRAPAETWPIACSPPCGRAGRGGDLRGMQSAAILIVEAAPTGKEWVDRVLDLGSKTTTLRSMSSSG
jgi:hypothetical protein